MVHFVRALRKGERGCEKVLESLFFKKIRFKLGVEEKVNTFQGDGLELKLIYRESQDEFLIHCSNRIKKSVIRRRHRKWYIGQGDRSW